MGNMHTAQQTSFKMYWSLASDLWAITTNSTVLGGSCLLRDSSNFAYSNATPTVALKQNATLAAPLSPGWIEFEREIGPFGAIDVQYLAPPRSLLTLHHDFMASLTALVLTNPEAQADYLALNVPPRRAPVPAALLARSDVEFVGGNVFCGDDSSPWPPANGLYMAFSFTNLCHATFAEVLQTVHYSPLFAFLSAGESRDLDAICALDAFQPSTCVRDHIHALSFLTTHNTSFAAIPTLAVAATADVRALKVGYVQFLRTATATTIARVPILDQDDAAWCFYGWHVLLGWAIGLREVVTLVGDHGRITAISAVSPNLNMVPDPNAIPQSFSFLVKYCVQYITLVLILVSGLLALSAMYHKGHMEARNLLCVNRIVGMTWLGRPFVLVRSLSAIWLLNTSPLTLVQVGVGTRFTSPPLAWYTTLLATSEMTWFVYVLNDLFSCITQQYTSLYASKSSNLTWLAAFVWTLRAPQTYVATVYRECSRIDMDAGVDCTSGSVAVGSATRLVTSLGLVVACSGLVYAAVCLCSHAPPPCYVRSPLLNAQSYYMLRLQGWRVGDVHYLDKTSAIMAGLLCVSWQGRTLVFDIKSWRILETPIAAHADDRLVHAIPLIH
ncbi:hypothetical protein ACHHYP_07679 [Achlya hypogyna]|uniref:Transmembrane protein n=1 Tax=Achlya hypogyna TaxID=1202772 RepID=A0A1V9YQU5_ACHHY|nr:hypothetical protein ACHHYP_07679 [Achlya hypogyna]